MGFEASVRGGLYEGARLDIERVPAQGKCNACHAGFTVENLLFQCPRCGSNDVLLETGQEIEISYLEIDDTPETGT